MLESNDPKFEFINYYGNTTIFALQSIRAHGNFSEMNLLSVGCLMPHFADFLTLFRAVHHNTMAITRLPMPPEKFPAKLILHQKDFFELPPLDVDCVISHAAIHCFNDTRYGNVHTQPGWQRPYQAAAKLRTIVGDRRLPVIVSVSINRDEGFFDNNAHLAHEKFIGSFEKAGFKLQDHFFDYVCGGIPQKPEYMNYEYRRAKTLPEQNESPKHWVIGNYFFL